MHSGTLYPGRHSRHSAGRNNSANSPIHLLSDSVSVSLRPLAFLKFPQSIFRFDVFPSPSSSSSHVASTDSLSLSLKSRRADTFLAHPPSPPLPLLPFPSLGDRRKMSARSMTVYSLGPRCYHTHRDSSGRHSHDATLLPSPFPKDLCVRECLCTLARRNESDSGGL